MSSMTLANVPVGRAFDFSGDSYTLIKHNSKNARITDGRNEFNLNRQVIVQNVREAAPVVEESIEEQVAGIKRMIEAYRQANVDALFEGESGRVVCLNVHCAGMTLQSDIVFSGKTTTFTGLGYERYKRMSAKAVASWRKYIEEADLATVDGGLCDCGAVK